VTRTRRMTSPRRRGAAAGLVAALIGLLAGGYLVGSALAASGPTISVTFPANAGAYNAAGWAAGCSPAGICGTASAANGFSSVAVSIRQQSTGDYWNGSSFVAGSPIFNTATGTTSWNYSFTPPTESSPDIYQVEAQVTDEQDNHADAVVSFTYQTAPPPAPVITVEPSNPTSSTGALFTFYDTETGVTLWCSLDSSTASKCDGFYTASNLSVGQHCFAVYAVDPAGNQSPTTSYCWVISGDSPTFGVGGNLTTDLYPGTTEPLDMTFTNPSSVPIEIQPSGLTSSNIAVSTSDPTGCPASNFEVTQGLQAAITIPADTFTPVSLQQLDVSSSDWPAVEMVDTDTNQDACEGVTLTLTYSGIEASGS
jgi:hypothetical protein